MAAPEKKPFHFLFKRGKLPSTSILPEDRVKLPPLLGIKPGHYLAVLYAAALLCVLFLALLYPGLSKPGAEILAVSEPSRAALRIDGLTLGATPCKVFAPHGKRKIEMLLPGFESYAVELDVKGRVFASFFFPKTIKVSGKLELPSPDAALAGAAAEYALWALAGEPTEASQSPLSLSEGVYRIGPAAVNDPAFGKRLDALVEESGRFAQTKAAVRDLLRAKFLSGNGGLSPSPLSLIRSMQEAASWIGAAPPKAVSAWLSGLGLDGFTPARDEDQSVSISSGPLNQGAQTAISLNGREFIPVPAGTVLLNGVSHETAPFFIASDETDIASWEAFTQENPEWKAENREALIESGLVSLDYLRSVDSPAYPVPAVPGISWYAAKAYCFWLSGKLPPDRADLEVRLPVEAEWAFAALYFEGRSGGPKNMPGGLWEWCEGYFAPLEFFPASAEGGLESPFRPVRGGSWVNQPGSVGIGTRGALPPESSSPFTGFRPVIAVKKAG